MKLSEVKQALQGVDKVEFQLPNGKMVPAHFHVTEIGEINKNFIDCGGTIRKDQSVSFQLWSSIDFHHRLSSEKLQSIIDLSVDKLGIGDHEVEVEYQSDTIGKYSLDFDGKQFRLVSKRTDCLAKDDCGIPGFKKKVNLSNLVVENCCEPSSGCC
ncbi:MAG: hypothetical protein HKN89_03505 [Eudoraea sp.]|nr:hypothetical protein [Eudoraea sp.]NNE28728.1 hypothetical protein [Saprospiraceae bacterium]